MKWRIPNINPQKIKARLIATPLISNVIEWSKNHSFPGFSGVPIADVIIFLYNEIKRFSLVTRANSIAYSFFLSIFPIILALLTLVPYFSSLIFNTLPGETDFMVDLQQQLNFILPGDIGNYAFESINALMTDTRPGLLSMGFILAVFFASNGMLSMMKSFEKSYDKTFKKRNVIRKRLIAIALLVQIGILLLASITLVVLGDFILNWLVETLEISRFTSFLFSMIRYVVMILLFYTSISIIYRYGAPMIQKSKFFSPGATLATLLSLVSSEGFSWFLNSSFNRYSELYDSFATVIVVMIWIQLNAFVLLVGFELNAAIAVNRDLKVEREEND